MNKKDLCRASLLCTGLRLSKNLYNEKGRPPYPYKSAKSRDLCVAFCTSQGRGAPLVRWPDGHTFFGPVSGRPYFLCFSAYNRPGAGAQYGSGGSPPAPCKNSKKWPKPLFRHTQTPDQAGVFFYPDYRGRIRPMRSSIPTSRRKAQKLTAIRQIQGRRRSQKGNLLQMFR